MTTQYIIIKNLRTKHSLLTLDWYLNLYIIENKPLYWCLLVSYSVTFLSFVLLYNIRIKKTCFFCFVLSFLPSPPWTWKVNCWCLFEKAVVAVSQTRLSKLEWQRGDDGHLICSSPACLVRPSRPSTDQTSDREIDCTTESSQLTGRSIVKDWEYF